MSNRYMHSHSRECILGRKFTILELRLQPGRSMLVELVSEVMSSSPSRGGGEVRLISLFFFLPMSLSALSGEFSKRSSFTLNNHLLKVWISMSFELLNKMCCINGFWQSIHIHVVYTHEIQSHTYKILNL